MAFEHDAIIRAQYQQLVEDRARAVADLESGRISEDQYTTMEAANRILEADQKRAALDNIANNYIASQQQPQSNRYGLSRDEVEIAHGIAGNDPHMSLEQRELVYAQNKQKLRMMRQSGEYRDDNGRVTR
jgi:hypothetical protein